MAKTFRQEMVGFPYWQVAVLAIARFSEPIAFTSPFPYIYFMVRDFGFDEDDISKYCGYLSSIFAFFQFLCCIQWGYLSDKIGRKPVLIIGLTGTMISILIFGFSKNYYQALFARALMGCINGNVAVIRTSLGETTNKPRHQGLALSVVPLLWQIGCIIGPLSGYLVDIKYDESKSLLTYQLLRKSFTIEYSLLETPLFGINNHIIDSIFGKDSQLSALFNKFPYALSNVIVALFILISLIFTVLFLEETNPKYRNEKDIGLAIGDSLRRLLGFKIQKRQFKQRTSSTITSNYETQHLLRANSGSNSTNTRYGTTVDDESTVYEDIDAAEGRSIDSDIDEFTITSIEPTSSRPPILLNDTNISRFSRGRLPSMSSAVHNNNNFININSIDDDHNTVSSRMDTLENVPQIGRLSRRASYALVRTYSLTAQNTRQSIRDEMIRNDETHIPWNVLLEKNVSKCIVYSFNLSLHSIIFDEFLPIFLSSDIARDLSTGNLLSKFPFHVWGGLGWDSKSVGSLLSSTGGIGCFIVLFLYPYIDRYYSPVKALSIFNLFYIPAYLFTPLTVFLLLPNFSYLNQFSNLSTFAIYFLCFIRTFGNAISNPLLVLITHKLAPSEHRALINGSTLSISALARFVGPTVWGYLMSEFMRLGLGELTFWSLAFICAICAYLNFTMYSIKFNEEQEDESTIE